MKRYILASLLWCVFTADFTSAGKLIFDEGTRIKSHLLSVSGNAVPIVIDYNHDNKKDLIVGDKDGYVWFYQNVGSDESPEFMRGSEVIKVASNAAPFVVDWDDTNDLDLIVGDSNGNLMLFTSSNGAPFGVGSLGINSHLNAAPYVYDWNDDGKKDLIIGDKNGHIWVYLNKGTSGSPVFTQDGYQVVGTGGVVLDVGEDAIPRVVDWDGNKSKDLIVGNSEGDVYVFLSGTQTQGGTPTFTTGKKIQASYKDIDVGFNAAPFITDWNKDEKIDLLVGELDGSLNLYLNSSTKPPVFSISSKIAGEPADLDAGSRVVPFVIDFDKDGNKDLIVGDEYGYIKLYRNSGSDKEPVFTDGYIFQENPVSPRNITLNHASPFIYDWNHDGNKDLIVGDEWGYIYLFYGSATSPIFTSGTKATTGTGTKEALKVTYDATPVICDWDNDGDMDIIVGDIYGKINIFINSNNDVRPIFPSSPQQISIIDVGNNAKPFVVDFDKDGKKDLVIGNDEGYVKVYLNIGSDENPVFTTEQSHHFQIEVEKVSGYSAPVVVDWNGDNIYDLIVGEKEGYINLYTGTILNSPPKVILDTPKGTQSNNVTINYYLKDDEQNVCSVVVKYSIDFGNSWTTATAVMDAGDGVSNLNSSKEGVRHSFVWNSTKNLGDSFIGQVIIKIIPYDSSVEGKSGETNEFVVDNKNPPQWERIKVNGADLNQDAYSTPIVVDWDGDGKRDLITGSEKGYVYFCRNVASDNAPEFNLVSPLQLNNGNLLCAEKGFSTPFVYDWNSDGKKDLLVGDGEGYVTFFENIGSSLNPSLSPGTRIKVDTQDIKVINNAVPVVVDWNKDGYKDLIVGDKNGNVWLYLNKNVSPQLDASPLLATGVKIQGGSDLDVGLYATPYVVDIDYPKDYKDDLIIGNSDGYLFCYKNIGTNGTPSFISGVKLQFEKEDIKVDAHSRPAVMKQDNDKIDLLVGSKDGYVFLYHLTQLAMNLPPQLTITNPKGTQTIQVGSVSINYILVDEQWDTCNITVEFSLDGQYWYPATGTPKTNLASSPLGTNWTFTWFSKEDILATKTYVYLRIIPNDGKVAGATATISFYLRNQNNLPIVNNVTVKSLSNGQVEISYDLQDVDNDLCQVFVMYQGGSKGMTWATATVAGTMTALLPQSNLKLIWLSSVDEKNQSAKDYKIKVTPYDIEDGTSGYSTSFGVDNSSISSAIAPKGSATILSFSPTTIEMLEPFSNDYDVLITIEKNPKGIPEMKTLASLSNTVRKITLFKLADMSPLLPLIKAKITIPYDNLDSGETENLLRIFELREGNWVLLEGKQSVDVVNNRVTAEVEHFSVFRIGLSSTTLSNFKVYPNPFKDNDGDKYNGEIGVAGYDYIVFQGVNKVEIYTLAGELVRESKDGEIDASGCWKWDIKNNDGRLVGSGIYIYVVKDGTGASLIGRLGVIR